LVPYDRAVPARAFADLVAAMDGAMLVVTAAVGEERDGCLVGFHSQSSIHPPQYVVWLSTTNRTWRLAARADHLGVHLLDRHQHHLAEQFGGLTGDEVDKLRDVAWSPGPDGVPLLDECPNRFVGRVLGRHDAGGDHVGVTLEPVAASFAPPLRPLRFGDVRDIEPGHLP
jgi:flavin reductase (DIM6/NTAB) family NADH-FMN oxidoreductase RutF